MDGEHVVYYDHTNKTDLLVKLKHALDHPQNDAASDTGSIGEFQKLGVFERVS